METQATKQNNEKLYLAIIALLVLICGVLSWQLFESKSNYQVIAAAKQDVESERNDLKNELNQMLKQYDELKTDNQEISAEMLQQQKQIKDLLDQVENSKGNAVLVARFRKEVVTLRTVMKSYVVTIDSLNTLNKQLFSENEQVKTELGSEKNKNEALVGKTKEMEGVIAKASQLKAITVKLSAVRLRSTGTQIETDRASKAEILKACFKIAENATAKAGLKTVYIKIIRPDGTILSENASESTILESINSSYSAKRELDYQNKESELCVYTKAKSTLPTGNYTVQIFEAGTKIGSGSLQLK